MKASSRAKASFMAPHVKGDPIKQHMIGNFKPTTPRQARRMGKRVKRMTNPAHIERAVMRHGLRPMGSNSVLHAAAHHGVPAVTHHGIVGGLKPHHITGVPRVKPVKSGMKAVRSVEHKIRVPHSMKAVRPGIPHIHI